MLAITAEHEKYKEEFPTRGTSIVWYIADPIQGGVTPIDNVLRSATAVKVGQDQFSILTVDFRRKFVLTIDPVSFIFAIFSCITN